MQNVDENVEPLELSSITDSNTNGLATMEEC